MGYQFREGAPTVAEEKLSEWLPDMLRFSAAAAGGAVAPSISEGYPVIFPSLDEIAGAKLGANNAVSWRYLIFSGEHVVGEVEIDKEHTPIAFHRGLAKDGLVAALTQAEAMTGLYTATVVISPPLKFAALWLHKDDDDLIIPFPPNATTLKNYQPVSLVNALKILQPISRRLLDTPAGNSGG